MCLFVLQPRLNLAQCDPQNKKRSNPNKSHMTYNYIADIIYFHKPLYEHALFQDKTVRYTTEMPLI